MAEVKVLLPGYLMKDSPSGRGSCSTISLVKDGEMVMVVDPGTVKSQSLIVEALSASGLSVSDVTHVGITHGHVDHNRNNGMFPNAITVNYDGIWTSDECVYSNEEEVVRISENVQTVKTPGHSYDSITFLISIDKGKVAICGDVFWKKDYPLVENDPYASDREKLKESRAKVLELADFVVSGHGEEYEV